MIICKGDGITKYLSGFVKLEIDGVIEKFNELRETADRMAYCNMYRVFICRVFIC